MVTHLRMLVRKGNKTAWDSLPSCGGRCEVDAKGDENGLNESIAQKPDSRRGAEALRRQAWFNLAVQSLFKIAHS
jgi:hypothetical protein